MRKLCEWAVGQIVIIWITTLIVVKIDYLKNLGLVMAVLLTALVLTLVLIGCLMMGE